MNKKISSLFIVCLALSTSVDRVLNTTGGDNHNAMPTYEEYSPEEYTPVVVTSSAPSSTNTGTYDYSKTTTVNPTPVYTTTSQPLKPAENVSGPTLESYTPETKNPQASSDYVFNSSQVKHYQANEIPDNKDFVYLKCAGYDFIARECAEAVPNTCGFYTLDLKVLCGLDGGCYKSYSNPCEACKDPKVVAVQTGPGCPSSNYVAENTHYVDTKATTTTVPYTTTTNTSNNTNYTVTPTHTNVDSTPKPTYTTTTTSNNNSNYIVTSEPTKVYTSPNTTTTSNNNNNNYIVTGTPTNVYTTPTTTTPNNNYIVTGTPTNVYNTPTTTTPNNNYIVVGTPTNVYTPPKTTTTTPNNNYIVVGEPQKVNYPTYTTTSPSTPSYPTFTSSNDYNVQCKDSQREVYSECSSTDKFVCARLEDHTTEYYRCASKACADRHVVSYNSGLCSNQSSNYTPYYCKASDRLRVCSQEYTGVCAVTNRGLVEVGTQCQACSRNDVIAVYAAKCSVAQSQFSSNTYSYSYNPSVPTNSNYIVVGEPQKVTYPNTYTSTNPTYTNTSGPNNGNYIIVGEPVKVGGSSSSNYNNQSSNYIVVGEPQKVTYPNTYTTSNSSSSNYNNGNYIVVGEPQKVTYPNTYTTSNSSSSNYNNGNYIVVGEPQKVTYPNTYTTSSNNSNGNYVVVGEPKKVTYPNTYTTSSNNNQYYNNNNNSNSNTGNYSVIGNPVKIDTSVPTTHYYNNVDSNKDVVIGNPVKIDTSNPSTVYYNNVDDNKNVVIGNPQKISP